MKRNFTAGKVTLVDFLVDMKWGGFGKALGDKGFRGFFG